MLSLDLSKEHLDLIIKIIQQYIPNYKVIAFGSRVNGKSHQGSDLDLAIINLQDESKFINNFISFKQSLIESNLPILVDVLDWSSVPSSFKTEILKQYIVVWPSGGKS